MGSGLRSKAIVAALIGLAAATGGCTKARKPSEQASVEDGSPSHDRATGGVRPATSPRLAATVRPTAAEASSPGRAPASARSGPKSYPTIEIDAPSEATRHPQGARAIMARIDELAGRTFRQWCADVGLSYPPEAVFFQVFKRERELEIWAKNSGMKEMVLVRTLPVCAMDFEPGTKLQEGDGKTPEGVYHPKPLYGSSLWWMWMKLTKEHIDDRGVVGDGSPFRFCIDYPTAGDRRRAKSIGINKAGFGICLHGNCVSAGCISFTNRNFLAVFAFGMSHQRRYGDLEVRVYPFRFDCVSDLKAEAVRAASSGNLAKLGASELLRQWQELKTKYEQFARTKNP